MRRQLARRGDRRGARPRARTTTRRCAWRSWLRSPIAWRAGASRARGPSCSPRAAPPSSATKRRASWLVAVDAEERTAARGGIKGARGGIVEVRLGSTIEPEWLLDLYPERIEEVDRRAFDPGTERVERTTGLRYGALMLDETVAPAPLDEETSRLLADAVLARGPERLPGGDALPPLLHRLAFARRQAPDAPFPSLDDGDVAGLVRAACAGRGSFAELGDAGRARALGAAARRATRAGDHRSRTGHAGQRAQRPDSLRRRRHALDRIAPAGLLRNACGARPWAPGASR